jgi:glyoxylase-like metal-dependent hydrolase (beta-lactamase superfamily II)
MKGCRAIVASTGLALALLLPVRAAGQGDRTPRAETAALGEGLYKTRVEWVNVMALRGPEGTLLVDTGFAPFGEVLASELTKIGAGSVKYVVNTHWHYDHTGGNASLGRGALIVAHDSVLPLLSRDQTLMGEVQKALPSEARPRLTFSDEIQLVWNSETVRVLALPGGHTGGDSIVLFEKANVLFIGDLVFQGQFPFVHMEHGGSAVRLPAVLQKALDLAPAGVKIVPGHGKDLTAEEVKAYRQVLLDTIEAVRKEMAKGKGLAAIQEEDPLKKWSAWDGSFTRKDWIEMVYRPIVENRSS